MNRKRWFLPIYIAIIIAFASYTPVKATTLKIKDNTTTYITVQQGEITELPKTIFTTDKNGKTKSIKVSWNNLDNSINQIDTKEPGEFNYIGTLSGSTKEIKLIIYVLPITQSKISSEGEWIYYKNSYDKNKIYKEKLDGTQRQKLIDDQISDFIVYDNQIYYFTIENAQDRDDLYEDDQYEDDLYEDDQYEGDQYEDDQYEDGQYEDDQLNSNKTMNYVLYKINTDGTNKTELYRWDDYEIINEIVLKGNWIYTYNYKSDDDNGDLQCFLQRININGTNSEELHLDFNGQSTIVDGNFIVTPGSIYYKDAGHTKYEKQIREDLGAISSMVRGVASYNTVPSDLLNLVGDIKGGASGVITEIYNSYSQTLKGFNGIETNFPAEAAEFKVDNYGWSDIYFMSSYNKKGNLYHYSPFSTTKKISNKNVKNFIIGENDIYYSTNDDNCIYKIEKDSTSETKIVKDITGDFKVTKNCIYYLGKNNLYKFDIKSKKTTTLIKAKEVKFYTEIDGWLYIDLKEKNKYNLYRINTNSKTNQIQPFGIK